MLKKKDPKSINDFMLYQRMVEEIQDYAIILMDKEGRIQNWNAGAEKIKQYSENEIRGKHFSIFYFPEDIQTDLPGRLLHEAESAGRAHHEGWRKRKDGSQFWGSITITAIHDDDHNVIGFVKVTRDLTDKKLAEDRLRLSEERYHQMIAEVQDYAIILLNEQGVIQNWNSGAERIKGYTADEIIGKKIDIFYTPEDRGINLPDKLLNHARTHGRATQEGWRVRKDKTRFWGTIVITALHDKSGNVIGFSKVTRDLTDKKEAEDKLMEYTVELEMQNRELQQFAYVASHDLQEPLRKIRTFTELIQENYGNKPFVDRYFDKLSTSAARMSQLIQSLLDYSRLGREKQEFTLIDLNFVLKTVLQDLELLVDDKSADITSTDLPVTKGIAIQLEQLFFNLISNSLKFARENIPVQIRISSEVVWGNTIDYEKADPYEKYYLLVFEDNGIGFEPEYANVIFSLFQRLHEKDEYQGTGIGLSLCRRIVENHNGFITASGDPGKGSVFRVYLPVE